MSDSSLNTCVDGLRPRAYQLEMLEASLKGNIIVAMDTGSGKTQIAILRTSKELEVCATIKIVWFLAPTVALCEQQHKAFSLQLPNVRIKLLLGRDNVDRWTSNYWIVALSGVRIAVSTHDVLADALKHGFVIMARLALLIFDEAHHCTRNHAANKIMGFYRDSDSKPKILGLTASPITRSKPETLRVIEGNLNSIARTPCVYRDEMAQYVHIPEVLQISYHEDQAESENLSRMLKSLVSHIESTEYSLREQNLSLMSEAEIAELLDTDIRNRSWTSLVEDQLKRFWSRALYIQKELGPWASDYYITKSISQLTISMHKEQNRHLGWVDEPKIRMLVTLGQLPVPEPELDMQYQMDTMVSNKCEQLLSFLMKKASSNFRGIIFAEQRVTVFVLHHLLSVHPGTKKLFKCGTFVGISANDKKTMELRDLLDHGDQDKTLMDFREGRKNLLIATTALEEGIDISACNVVICFNKPPNLRSYVQRRGRARQRNSTMVLLTSLNNNAVDVANWQRMEAEMIAEYMKDDRDLVETGTIDDHELDDDTWSLKVDSTGAHLKLNDALRHLDHFCQRLPSYLGMDKLPIFVFQRDEATGHFCAQVTLPNSVHPSVRRTTGLRVWPTEKLARKDAAFQAYRALYKAGLLNDHLLPLISGDMLPGMDGVEDLSSIVRIRQLYNPWHDVAKKWTILHKRCWKTVNVQCVERRPILMNLILPMDIPSLPRHFSLSLHGVAYTCTICVSEATEIFDVSLLQTATKLIFHYVPKRCWTDDRDDFVTLFTPQRVSHDVRRWLKSYSVHCSTVKNCPAGHLLGFEKSPNENLQQEYSSFHNEDCGENNEMDGEFVMINGIKLIEISEANETPQDNYPRNHLTSHGTSEFPIRHNEPTNISQTDYDVERFALLAPSIIHHLEILLVGKELRDRLLPEIQFRNLDLLVEAICATSAKELSSNKRLAFLGDTVLEFLVTSQLFANHATWHAGYLSAKKKLIISNSHLSRMALDVGLDKFMITEPFNQSTWKPPYVSDVITSDTESTRSVSKGMLADAVEALIGAAYIDGQYENAFKCVEIFLPEIMTHSLGSSSNPTMLDNDQENSNHYSGTHFASLEELIGYEFQKRILLAEAMTHPSYDQDLAIGSYGRLAFLGNAVLSMVIVESLCHEEPQLSQNKMTLLRVATINNGFLAFICLETYMREEYIDIAPSASKTFQKVHRGKSIDLWGFLRYGHPDLAAERSRFLERHIEMRKRIRQGLASDTIYPWRELAKLESNSDLPDIIQALFGAVFQDSHGDMDKCAQLAEKLRILPVLRDLLERKVDVLHPKTRLQEMTGDQQVTYLSKVEALGNEHRCTIYLNGNIIVEARDGCCKEEVTIRAAELAIIILEQKAIEQ